MFGHLKRFLKGDCEIPAGEVEKSLDELHIELMALPDVTKDFTTPEGAILCLEDAYRRRDIEAAVAAKDFDKEARMLLLNSGFKNVINDEVVAKMSEVLEMSFRAHTTAQWPDFDGLESFFPKKVEISDGVVAVTEVCRFPDGFFSRQEIYASNTADGWRVVTRPKKNEREDS